jgi:NAD(P)-dependent dehydrogenase (short-subunit alcohol dehydrogenase family)
MSQGAQRVAIVTGGERGIGAAIARRLAADGMAVAVLDLKEADSGGTLDAISGAGGRAPRYRNFKSKSLSSINSVAGRRKSSRTMTPRVTPTTMRKMLSWKRTLMLASHEVVVEAGRGGSMTSY